MIKIYDFFGHFLSFWVLQAVDKTPAYIERCSVLAACALITKVGDSVSGQGATC